MLTLPAASKRHESRPKSRDEFGKTKIIARNLVNAKPLLKVACLTGCWNRPRSDYPAVSQARRARGNGKDGILLNDTDQAMNFATWCRFMACAGVLWATELAASSSSAVPSPCGSDQARGPDLVPNTMFSANLAPYGHVCFVARKVPVPVYAETDYLQFELLRGPQAPAVKLPWPERYLWNGACRIRAVSFPRLDKGPQRSILILGRCNTAGDELDQALIYRGSPQGFKLDTPLSVDATGFDTIAKAEAWVRERIRQQPSGRAP